MHDLKLLRLSAALGLLLVACDHDVDPAAAPPPGVDEPVRGPAAARTFRFDATPPADLAPIDRMGMPAVTTAMLPKRLGGVYNESTPVDDADEVFVADIREGLAALHAALDDDLQRAGLALCATDACAAQLRPYVVPDSLRIDPALPPGFPNGRRPADQALDITLALLLLDLSDPRQSITRLADIPLNPPANDRPFLATFPYLAEPH